MAELGQECLHAAKQPAVMGIALLENVDEHRHLIEVGRKGKYIYRVRVGPDEIQYLGGRESGLLLEFRRQKSVKSILLQLLVLQKEVSYRPIFPPVRTGVRHVVEGHEACIQLGASFLVVVDLVSVYGRLHGGFAGSILHRRIIDLFVDMKYGQA